ncbi:hypothetical protein [Streptomyces sp. NPDC046870]|uniref:hypothetical protein n=1 Tax=Streptomyces sp. NPDC046870 TaxID=3155135 RepID=UPI003452F2E2
MTDMTYHQVLVDAGVVAPGGVAGGITPWRGPGLDVVRLMVETFLGRVARVAPPAETTHAFLDPQESYDRVFPTYGNVYRLRPGDRDLPGWVLRADNLHLNVAWLHRTGHQGPVVTTGGLLRRLRGSGTPLFRERYIWPAIQLNHVLPRGTGAAALEGYREVLESTFAAFGLPVLTVAVDAPAGYGDTCHLTVSCLRDGRPTVVATTYLMARRYREALGVDGELVDIGFTGKVLALVAMHHRDRWGLGLPSPLAPVQTAVLASPGAGPALDHWRRELDGIRADVVRTAPHEPYRRMRAERRLLRAGTPLVLGVREDGGWRIGRRNPTERERLPGPPTAGRLRRELASYDRRLLSRARERLDRSIERSGLVKGACAPCAAGRGLPFFGWVVPGGPMACAACGGPGRASLLSEQGRFY